MLIFLCVVLAVLSEALHVVGSATTRHEIRRNEFVAHAATYFLDISNEDEFSKRMKAYNVNMDLIESHNTNLSKSYTMGAGPFTHLSADEFKEYTERGRSKTQRTAEKQAISDRMPVHNGDIMMSAPELNRRLAYGDFAHDWRTIPGVVTPVKNQGQCGSCWTFGAVGALEGAYALMSSTDAGASVDRTAFNGINKDSATGFFGFSEQNFVDCDDIMSGGCNGGFSENAWLYAAALGGVPSEASYPYTDIHGPTAPAAMCSSTDTRKVIPNTAPRSDVPYTHVESGSLLAMKTAVLRQPVEVAVQAGASFPGANNPWQNYQSGVVTLADGCGQDLDHSVLVVGFTQSSDVNTKDYWIVKNSWTASWGDAGYIHIEMSGDENPCGLLTDGAYPNMLGSTPNTNMQDITVPTLAPTMPSSEFYPITDYMTSTGNSVTVSMPQSEVNILGIQGLEATVLLNVPNMDSILSQVTMRPGNSGGESGFVTDPKSGVQAAIFNVAVVAKMTDLSVNTYVAVFACETDSNIVTCEVIGTNILVGFDIEITQTSLAILVPDAISVDANLPVMTSNGGSGIGIKGFKFSLSRTYPTTTPTLSPTADLNPRPAGGVMMATTTRGYYSTSDCTGMPVKQVLSSYGLCEPNPAKKGTYQIVVPGTPLVTNPQDPYNVPITITTYTDAACTTVDVAYPASFMTVNSCEYSAFLSLYESLGYVRQMTDAGAVLTPAFTGPVEMPNKVSYIRYTSDAACRAKDMKQAIVAEDVTVTGCYGGVTGMTCTSAGLSELIYPANSQCPANGSVYDAVLFQTDSDCTNGVWASTCSGGDPTTSSAQGNKGGIKGSYDVTIALGSFCGVLLILVVYLYFSYSKAMTVAIVTTAAAGDNKNPIHGKL